MSRIDSVCFATEHNDTLKAIIRWFRYKAKRGPKRSMSVAFDVQNHLMEFDGKRHKLEDIAEAFRLLQHCGCGEYNAACDAPQSSFDWSEHPRSLAELVGSRLGWPEIEGTYKKHWTEDGTPVVISCRRTLSKADWILLSKEFLRISERLA